MQEPSEPLPSEPSEPLPDMASTKDADVPERDMSEQQLRELYDSEEIDRFLHLFSAYVTEVQLREDTVRAIDSQVPNISRPSSPTSPLATRGLSEAIAQVSPPNYCFRYLVPILPTASPQIPLFTLGRLRLTTQRLYLAIQPVYVPFFASLLHLATWKNRKKSSVYCIVFWILWYQNLLLPCLFLQIIYALARRKLFSYPTLAELRAHRQEIDRAAEFGEQLSTRFLASSSFGAKELWRLFKVFNKSKKTKIQKAASSKTRDPVPLVDEQDPDQEEISTVLDSDERTETAQENDVKRALLQMLSEIADLHERVKNIFIWRRPASSQTYGMVLIFLFLLTLFLPAKFLAKLTYFVGGFLFWHVTPVIAALPSTERARLPPAFSDVPTDAEFAMELISQRVAAGLDIRPIRSSSAKGRDKKEQDGDMAENGAAPRQSPSKDKDVNWQKWGQRAAVGMTWAEDGKRIFTAGEVCTRWPQNTNRVPPSLPTCLICCTAFPAQHSSAPGLITLTTETLFFTPLMSSIVKLEIPLRDLQGVKKKSGLFTALTIAWVDSEGSRKDEIFRWVGGRDELFARLVGTGDGKRWMKA
ncbi:hypothetical protein DFH06DRAFT_1437038 [Mycena polygramma]|nr:hypothetical protein DFH06DRAFT_1437038 [Mycena polygramma]